MRLVVVRIQAVKEITVHLTEVKKKLPLMMSVM